MLLKRKIWDEAATLFHDLVDLNQNEQEDKLFVIQKNNETLYTILVELLQADKNAHTIFKKTPASLLQLIDSDTHLIGTKLGAFRIQSVIGHGAMGTVFKADRADGQFHQVVAIKLMKTVQYDDSYIEFFKRERQILASLNHPNIARLYDAGFAQDQRPYMVMEWVNGETLLEHCSIHNFGLNKRIELFLQVCEAVRYAHISMIAHLDIKPQNIIVNQEGHIKLLDFGVSKITEDSNAFNAGNFTLAYAAPEQVLKEGSNTKADIYALGIVFGELLTGTHPFSAFFTDFPLLKEAVIHGKKKDFALVANYRSTPFQNDLKAIFDKATKKEPDERYHTVDELIRDIKDHLSHHTVSAKNKTWHYTFKKYVLRNRNVVVPVVMALLMLMSMAMYYTSQLKNERNIAQSEARKAKQINSLLTDVFSAADPNVGGVDTITAVQLLDQGLVNLEKNLGEEPLMYAEMLSVISPVYLNLGRYNEALALAKKAYTINLRELSGSPEILSDNEIQIASVYYYKGDIDSAGYFSALAVRRLQDAGLHKGLFMASALHELGNTYYDQGYFDQADSVFRLSYSIYKEYHAKPHSDIAQITHMIGTNERKRGNYQQAENMLLEALELKRNLYKEPHLEIAYTCNHLGSLYQEKGEDSLALAYIIDAYEQRKAILGVYHLETMASMSNLARNYSKFNKPEMAIPIYKESISVVDSLMGKSHTYYRALCSSLANAYLQNKDLANAKFYFMIADSLFNKYSGDDDVRRASTFMGLGKIAMAENRFDEAENYFRNSLRLCSSFYPEHHRLVTQSQMALGDCLMKNGNYSESIVFYELAYRGLQSAELSDSSALASLAETISQTYSLLKNQGKVASFNR
ncbi:MAG: serine/threonine protein kinase [Cyclobacteriaceae bacterium]|nr:serine/threonine protein kinase [Cyclobacteriaceae bacterium]